MELTKPNQKRPMTHQQILHRVNQEASHRFLEVIEKVFCILRNRHAHNAYKKECFCDYCRFIISKYTDEKIRFHSIKRIFDTYGCTNKRNLHVQLLIQKEIIEELKLQKNDLKFDVI